MKKFLLTSLIVCSVFILIQCSENKQGEKEAPILSVEESIKDFEIENGFVAEASCAEPLIEDPVALCFDEDAAMWVVEMRGYMHDKEGSGENLPSGRIKILKDTDADGKYDQATIFLDSLIMPRAIAIVKNGILLIEPPSLYFIESNNGIAGKKVLLDSTFADTGNPEHQPNGLIRGMDNWHYCSSSSKRVKKINDNWVVENTQWRGQWGISNDDAGRLYYNNNSVMLMTDNFLAGSFPVNENFSPASRKISGVKIADNNVYPIRHTRGINRGYQKGMLDSVGKLINVTSACGPVIYRGDNFPKEYYGNAFVMEPAAYLVKRILLSEDKDGFVKGTFAYPDKEFLTSTDERFRPVNAYTGPDGCLYIIDMHRGVIQHTTFLTPYLRRHVDSMNLERPISLGRIYRLRWKEKSASKPLQLSNYSSEKLLTLLKHPNGTYHDLAHRLLVEKGDTSIASALKKTVFDNSNPVASLHSLWIMEGLSILTPELLLDVAQKTTDKKIYQSCLQILSQFSDQKKAFDILRSLRKKGDRISEIYFINSLSSFYNKFYSEAEPLLIDIAKSFPNDVVMTDAILSGLQNKENKFLLIAGKNSNDTVLPKALNKAIANLLAPKDDAAITHLTKSEKQSFNAGKRLYISYCSACHGKTGEGIDNIAPPLIASEWVSANEIEIPTRILLDGMAGPVSVNGVRFSYPNTMPGLRDNIETNNGEIANILTFIRNSFGNKASAINSEQVGKIRAATKERKLPYQASELKK